MDELVQSSFGLSDEQILEQLRLADETIDAVSYTHLDVYKRQPEGRAYRLFGDRCGLRQYQKLAALLEQNMRTGTRGMRQLLEEEMALALEQRKDLAKRQGEEAGTKLLLPLLDVYKRQTVR